MRHHNSLILIAVLLLSASAQADEVTLKKVDNLNRIALEDHDLGDDEAAKKTLVGALELLKSKGLERHAAAARTHVHLGVVLGAGLKQRDPAVDAFVAALEIDRTATIPAGLASPELAKLLEEARKKLAARTGAPAPADIKDEDVRGIVHVPVASGQEGEPILIEARVGADVRAKAVMLRYRPQGAEAFVPVPLQKVKGTLYRAQIGAEATAVDTIVYYVEATNAKNKVVATRGNAAAPYTIAVTRKVKPRQEDDELDDEDPLAKKRKGKK